jgi:hypothetical protein
LAKAATEFIHAMTWLLQGSPTGNDQGLTKLPLEIKPKLNRHLVAAVFIG